MTPEQLEIAIANAGDQAAKSMLKALVPTYEKYCALDRSFVERINASKVARGEGPTKLNKRKRGEIAEYEKDATEGERNLTKEFRGMSASSIIFSMDYALETALKFWGGAMLKHAHPADRAIIEEVVETMRSLKSKFEQFLDQYPPPSEGHDS